MVWARANVLEDYRCPSKIGEVTHVMMKYRDTNDEGVSVHEGESYYNHRPRTLQVRYRLQTIGCFKTKTLKLYTTLLEEPCNFRQNCLI